MFLRSFPVHIQIGSTSIPLHTITEVLGIFIAFRYFLYLKRKQGDVIEASNRVWILIAACFGAVVGSRLLGALEDPVAWMQSANKLMYAYQQKTIVGGLLGGLLIVELVKLLLREKSNSGDLFVYPLLLSMIIGRIGCFSMGVYEETYGLPSGLPWAMDLGDGLQRHPVALYEIVFLVLLWMALATVQTKVALANGALFKLFMICYFCFRFALDFIKPHYTWRIGLSSIQVACLLGLGWYAMLANKNKKQFVTAGAV